MPRPTTRSETAALLPLPLREALATIGMMVQERLANPRNVALLRVVMVDAARLPDLATTAYHALVVAQEERLDAFLAEHPDAQGVASDARRSLCAAFVGRLIGADHLRLLRGLEGTTEAERRTRSEAAAGALIPELD